MEQIGEVAKRRLDGLAKPVGSLGKLEDLAVRLCVAQGMCPPKVNALKTVVFAGDHGIHEEKVSPFPASVTVAMVQTMVQGKATVSCMAKNAGAKLEVVNVGVSGDVPIEKAATEVKYIDARVAKGSKNIVREPAMNDEEVAEAIVVGRSAVDRAVEEGVRVLSVGEIGICNTSIAAALAARILEVEPELVVGPGTGLDKEGVARKVAAVKTALDRGGSEASDPLGCLQDLGGFEIAAMVGCFLRCRERKVAAIVDGFIVSVAALVACKFVPEVERHLIFASLSPEPGHRMVLKAIREEEIQPLLDWGLRLGEASAATLCLPLIRASGQLFHDVATLEDVLAAAAPTEP